MTPCQKVDARQKSQFHCDLMLILSQNQTSIHEEHFNVAHFHINEVLSTRNMFKEVNVPKSRGALGTGFTYAPVCRAGGKPSTWFLPGTRRADHLILQFNFKISFIRSSSNANFDIRQSFSRCFHENSKNLLFFQIVMKTSSNY